MRRILPPKLQKIFGLLKHKWWFKFFKQILPNGVPAKILGECGLFRPLLYQRENANCTESLKVLDFTHYSAQKR